MCPNPFSPNGDGKYDTTSFCYSLSENANVTIKVYNYKGEVKTVLSNAYRAAGRHYEGWTGTNNSSQILPNGNYKYTIYATNSAGTRTYSGITCVYVPPLKISSVWMNPNPVSPNGDGKYDTTSFCYTVDQPCYVTIKVSNYLGVIKTVVENAYRKAGRHYEGWTGTDLLGHPLSNGTYGYTITAKNATALREHKGTITVVGVVNGGPRWIHLRLSARKLYLMDGNCLLKAYPVAVGRSSMPTPQGTFYIIRKDVNPTWYPPSWASETKPVPYPYSPLGPRRLLLSNPSYGIHGTLNPSSIGTNVTHGCIRLYNQDIIQLFDLVAVGTIVRITN